MTNNNDTLFIEQGKRLLELRKEFDLTVEEICAECGISKNVVYEYEKGTRFPGSRYLRFLHDQRNVNLNFIFGTEKRMFRPGTENTPPDFGNLQEVVDKMLRIMDEDSLICLKVLAYIEKLRSKGKVASKIV